MRRLLSISLASCLWFLASSSAHAILDTNENGVSDVWERHYNSNNLFSSFDPQADPDGDGWTNEVEAISGTDPFDGASPTGCVRPVITHIPAVYTTDVNGDPEIVTPEAVTITWPTLVGKQYELLSSTDLTGGSWILVGYPEIGTGEDMGKGIQLTNSDGSSAPSLFLRVAICDSDDDSDTLTGYEERALGTSNYFSDTDDDGISDLEAITSGLHPAGNGIDEDEDGIPDSQLYSVLFEFVAEFHNGLTAPGFGETSDEKSRYFTKNQSEKFSVSDSPRVTTVTDKTYSFKETYLENEILKSDAAKTIEENGVKYTSWFYNPANATPLGPDEYLWWQEEPMTITHTDPVTTVTAETSETVTTETRTHSWTIYKDGEVVRSGTETSTIERKTTLSGLLSFQDCWNSTVQAQPWIESSPQRCGPLNGVDQLIGAVGEQEAAPIVQSLFKNGNFRVSGTISGPDARNVYGEDHRIIAARWRWVRFDPRNPFEYHFAAPPASMLKKFNLLVEETNHAVERVAGQSVTTETTTDQGIIEIECMGNEGTTSWQEIPMSTLNAYKIETPRGFEAMDFVGKEGRTEVKFSSLPLAGLTGAGNQGDHRIEGLNESSAPPTVLLTPITTADVEISGGEATVEISGEVYDSIMGTVPAGKGADIGTVAVFLNGVETDHVGSLVRTTDHTSFLTPYGPKADIQPFTITVPANGVNRISVVTAPNAAGIKGTAEFEVVFEKNFGTAVILPAETVAFDILLPPSFSTTAKEIVKLAQPGQPASDDLEETTNDSRLFVSATTGASIMLAPAFQPTAIADTLRCLISTPSINFSGGGSDTLPSCTETGAETLRFSYSHTKPASSQGAPYEWELSSVDMGSTGYSGLSHPVTFRYFRNWQGDDYSLKWLGETFLISGVTPAALQYANTAPGKPLIGFLVPKQNEEGPDSREFIFYDHTTQELKRKPIAASVVDLPYQLKFGDLTTADVALPVRGWQLLTLDEQPSEGLLPVSIESLIDLAEGDTTVEIPEESQAIIEVSGRKPGEVVVMFSPEETDDRFDLTIPGEQPKITLRTRNAALVAEGTMRYRSQEKLVIYSSGGTEGPTTLTDAQWQALKAVGYLAVHNADPVIGSTKDLEWAIKKYGPVNLPLPNPDDPNAPKSPPMGTNGVTDPRKAQFYRFEGFTDHHVFNQYDKNEAKRLRWNAIFGNDFDVDEFTVPVQRDYHLKVGHQITNEWEEFLEESFDTNHKIKAGVNLQELQKQTLNKMREIQGRWGIDTSRLRPYPSILKDSITTRPALCNRLISNGGRLGSSLDKLKVIDEMAFGPLFKGANAARNAWWKDTAKKVFKREGRMGVGKLVPILSSAITVASIASASANVTQVGWEEAVAQEINNQLALDDIELAREAVRQQFNTGLIAGGTPRPVLPLPNGQVIGMNERTFTCKWTNSGIIYDVVPYVITEIKVFPDGTWKIAAVMEVPPFESKIEENSDFIIRDYWPKIGDSSELYLSARARAMANSNGNP